MLHVSAWPGKTSIGLAREMVPLRSSVEVVVLATLEDDVGAEVGERVAGLVGEAGGVEVEAAQVLERGLPRQQRAHGGAVLVEQRPAEVERLQLGQEPGARQHVAELGDEG